MYLTSLHVVTIEYNHESTYRDRDDRERAEMVEMIKIEGEGEAKGKSCMLSVLFLCRT